MPDPITDQQAERLADAYNLGIKAEGLREFADHLDAVDPYVPLTPRTIAAGARVKAADLDAKAESLATAPAAEPTEAQPDPLADLRHAILTEDCGDLMLTCHRCDTTVTDVGHGDWLTQLIATVRGHTCPEPADTPVQDGEQTEGDQ